MTNHEDEASSGAAGNIDQIRDIILGPQKREFEDRMQKLCADIQKLQDEGRARADELRDAMQTAVSTMQDSLDKGLRQLGTKLQAEVSSLRQEIDRVEKKAGADLAGSVQNANESTASLKKELRGVKEQLSKDLETHVSDLRDTKVSREIMAEMLQEVAMKLRGVEVLEELKKAVKS